MGAGIATMLGAGQAGVRIPTDTRNVSLLQDIQTGPGAHRAFYKMSKGVLAHDQTCPSWC